MVMDFFERFCYIFAISSKNDIFKEGYPMLTINETRLLNRIHALGSCPAGCARQDSPS